MWNRPSPPSYTVPILDKLRTILADHDRNGRLATDFVGHGAKCVKRRAILSVKANPNCADKADEYVDAAFDRCFKDTFPFDRHPNLR